MAKRVRFDCCVKSTEGTTLQMAAWLENDGVLVEDADATCVITFREHGADVLHFTAPASGEYEATDFFTFEEEWSNPNFTDDRLYIAKVRITEGDSTTHEELFTFPVIGGV